MEFLYGLTCLLLATLLILWTDPETYNQFVGSNGLHYIALGLGFVLGLHIFTFLIDRTYRKLESEHRATEPEFCIPVMITGSYLVRIGLFWYGWSAQAKLH